MGNAATATNGSGHLYLSGGRDISGRSCDVLIAGDRVIAAAPPGHGHRAGALPGSVEIDCTGSIILPAFVEPHTHLDKALTVDAIDAEPGDLLTAVSTWAAWSATLTEQDIRARARRTVGEFVANGVTALRTHANPVSGADPLLAVRALTAVRDQLRGICEMQVVFLARADTPDDDILEAVRLGVDLIGGAPHLAPDVEAEQNRLLDLAERAGVGVDLHTDEQLDPAATALASLAREVARRRFPKPVTASHCVSLGMHERESRDQTIQLVARAGIGIVCLPHTNLGLQGREWPTSPPRGLTALQPLLAADVPVAAGTDNVRDPFNPVGRADPLEIAALLVNAGQITVAQALTCVSAAARAVLGLPAAGPVAGLRADLVVIRANSLHDLVGRAPAERLVIHAGRVVSATRVSRDGPATGLLTEAETFRTHAGNPPPIREH